MSARLRRCPPLAELEQMPLDQLLRMKMQVSEEIVELEDKRQRKDCPAGYEYGDWHGRICGALKMRVQWRLRIKAALKNQNRKIYTEADRARRREWFAGVYAALKESFALFRRLAEEGVELEPDEIALVQRLGELIAQKQSEDAASGGAA